MEEVILSEKENIIFQSILFFNDTGLKLSLINWVMNIENEKIMITSDTKHELIFHKMWPGLKRQVTIGTGKGGYKEWGVKKYTLDFYDENAKIAYEIDGYSHSTKLGKAKDNYRDKLLLFLYGIRTVRYTNKEVENQLKQRIKDLGVEHFGFSD